MTDDDKALVAAMKDQIESWEFEDPREDWWRWQHEYAQAADRIEVLSAKLAEAEALLELQNQDIGRLRNNQDYGAMTKEDYEAIYGWGGQG